MPRGVRLNPKHDERTRAKIQTSQIINRLTEFVNGDIEMSGPQVTAAKILLDKTLPNLQATELSGEVNGTLTVKGLLEEIDGRSRGLPGTEGEAG